MIPAAPAQRAGRSVRRGRRGARRARFGRAELAAVLARVCAVAGLDPEDATLLRVTNNAVFRLARQPVVVRVVASRALRHRVAKVVRVAEWLAQHDVPAVRLWGGVPQPVRVGPHRATLWHAVPEVGDRPTGVDLARLLRRLHALPPPPFPLPHWEPLDDVRRRLADAEEELDPDDRAFLEQRCAEVAAELAGLEWVFPRGPVHGDAHLGNLIPGPDGPVLCDFDSTCHGPREWDLTPVAVGQLRFRRSSAHEELAAAYGFDVMRWSGFPVLRAVRELKLVTSVLPVLRSNPGVAAELRLRLRSFRSGDTSVRWTPYR
ncbi:Phosphotransferase enzyme family protein [Streptoalloteichus tenebrarius]|uniref:Phosphotransferase enzyme family protein n=1 Tax=Streptoalloteichus tenebrarius (strain ATCC 17920 / DSM 40477 / JCM 4838 / CBS 697.72 / NBRC 16177 / NCIMB 11028 / NRRL B-12390 / A12253. 1 / ISP 5477) TaxID=1933 RepID=A0ABT1HYY6_STRSD|nr:Phosphotransferase enzyme family protein [Streptoalloteichus tenebrarius]